MDAVAEARTSVTTALESWAKDGKTLMQTAKTLGVETDRFAGMFGGTIPAGTVRGPGTRRARRPGGRNGSSATTVTEAQLLEHLSAASYNQTQLAKHFHTTPQTIRRRIRALGSQVTSYERDGQKFWTSSHRAAIAGIGSSSGGGTG